MLLKQQKNKGIVITIVTVLEASLVLGLLAFLYWFFLSRVLEIHVSIDEATTERHAINLANVLISSEKLAYQENGKTSRGILDADKLGKIFLKRDEFIQYARLSPIPKDIGIGYPNTLSLVEVLDLESCQDLKCDGWAIYLSGPLTAKGLSVVEFAKCMAQNEKIDIGYLFRSVVLGPLFGRWQPWDIAKCVKNNIPPSLNSVFTGTPISSRGLPVLIRYSDGTLHDGRIIVGVAEWY